MFRALSHQDFRRFWIGAFLSNVGTWMQAVAQGWLMLELTNSAFWLGLDAFMATAPGFVLTLVGGVFADLIDRRRLLLYTQVGAGVAALETALGAGSARPKGASWWARSDVKRICAYLFGVGALTTGARVHFQRLYDLPERVLPPEVLATHPADPEASARDQN